MADDTMRRIYGAAGRKTDRADDFIILPVDVKGDFDN